MNAFKNQKGLTLVEVLAALAILGIVFVGIMTIFPQMTLFNAKTEAKLDTMNLARQEMERIVSTSAPEVWVGDRDSVDFNDYEEFEEVLSAVMVDDLGYTKDTSNVDPSLERYERNIADPDYRYEADIYISCEALISEPSGGLSCNNPSLTQLYKVHLKVFNGSYLSSETYSYIKFYVEE